MSKYLIISKDTDEDSARCQYCDASVALLDELQLEYIVRKLTKTQRIELYDELGLLGDDRRVPQNFFINDDGTHRRIGGFVALRAHLGVK